MIGKSVLTTAASLLLAFGASASTHQFTSADGSKKLEATLLGYDAQSQTIQIRVVGGRTMTAPLSAFSKEDAEYVAKAQQRLEVGRRMSVNIDDDGAKPVETKTATARTKKLSTGFKVNFRNNGTVPMEDVTAKYRIFFYEDLVKGGKADKFKDGELLISSLKPRESVDLETEKVDLVTVRASTACLTWPNARPATASSRFDKMEGMILVLMKDGEVLKEVKYPTSLRKEFTPESESGAE